MDHKVLLFAAIILFFFILMQQSIKLALLVYLVLCPFNIFIPVGSININSTEAVALMFIVFWLFGAAKKEKLWIPDSVFTYPLFCYFLASFLLIINSGLTGEVILSLVRHFQFFGVFMIFVTYFKDRKDIYTISNALMASLAALCLVAIVEFIFVYGGSGIPWQRSIVWKMGLMDIGLYPGTDLALKRLTSAGGRAGLAAVFSYPTPFGIYMGFLMYLLAWRLFLHRRMNRKKIAMMVLLAVSFAILILTKGRTAIFSFLLSIPPIVLLLRNWRLRFTVIIVLALSLILLFVFLPDMILNPLIEWIEILSSSGFSSLGQGDLDRIEYFIGSLRTFLRHPLTGVGYRIYEMEINPHNGFTQALVMKGILGGLTLLWVLVRMFRVGRKSIRKIRFKKAKRERILASGWLLSISIYLAVQSIGVVLFGYVLTCIPAIAAMTMYVISSRNVSIEKREDLR